MTTLFQHKTKERWNTIRKAVRTPFVSWSEPISLVDPLEFFHLGEQYGFQTRFYWSDRNKETTYVGIGCTYTIATNENEARFMAVETEWKRFIERTTIHSNQTNASPILFGGFSFDPLKRKSEQWQHFSDAKFVVPTVLLTVKNGEATVTITLPSELEESEVMRVQQLFTRSDDHFLVSSLPSLVRCEERGKEEWIKAVEQVIARIRTGEFAKVVLAREERFTFADRLDVGTVLERLCEQQPMSYLFAFEQDGRCFIGASPEQLVKKEGTVCYSTCLAGSIRRGKTMREDEELGNWLLQDEKNLREHQFVVEMIKEAMAEMCDTISIPPRPQLLKMRDIQHLYTPVVGDNRRNVSLLSLVERLHPTPALGGTPRETALETIRALEPLDRGWYAAPIGWIDVFGNGEFAVAIRSGLLQGKEAILFAGCGVVGDSDPASEYEETKVKLKPMLSALGVNRDER